MENLQFITALIGGLGIGSLFTTLVTKWLEGRRERSHWLRDRRHVAYSALAKELQSMGMWAGTTSSIAASATAAEAILLLDDDRLGERILAFFDDLEQTRLRVLRVQDQQQHENEYARLKAEATAIVGALRQHVLR
jgi:hypothetical protein